MVGLSPKFVCHGQYWLLYLPVFSVVDNNGWYITWFCLSWTIMIGIAQFFFCRGQLMVGIATVFVCHGQLLLV